MLYGLSADDADKKELADNRQDEEEVAEVEGSGRVEGWGIGCGVDFDLLRKASHNDKIILSFDKNVSLGKTDDHTVPFCL